MTLIKETIKYLCLFATWAFCIWVGYVGGKQALKYPEPFTPKIHSPAESQQELKDAGWYHGKIDGDWGPLSDAAYCDYMAARVWPKEK